MVARYPEYPEHSFFYEQQSWPARWSPLTPHGLHNEDSPLGSLGRLADPVADLRDLVESRVRADGEVCARDVVGDGGREDHHGNPELLELLASLGELEDCLECLESSNHDETLNLVLRQLVSTGLVVVGGQSPLGAEQGPGL